MGPRSQRDDAVGRSRGDRFETGRLLTGDFSRGTGGVLFFLGGGKEGRKEGHLMKQKHPCFIDVDVLR